MANKIVGIIKLQVPAGKADHIFWDDDLPCFGLRLRGATRRWIVAGLQAVVLSRSGDDRIAMPPSLGNHER